MNQLILAFVFVLVKSIVIYRNIKDYIITIFQY